MLTYCILFHRIPWWSKVPREVLSSKEDRTYYHCYLHQRAPRSCPGCWLWCGV